ncbi:MAG: DUF192 domain-containing protein [Bacteroidales bacterium]|nr:DUF192 domain-containing protein [Bacteroidales bacterium]
MTKVNRSTNRKGLKSKKTRKRKPARLTLFLLGFAIIITLFIIKPFILNEPNNQQYKSEGIKFKKEGQLSFYRQHTNEIISTIDIEIAEDDYERALGLMHRYSMGNNQGMLFIMDREEQQSFWMKNTYISLDIIFLDKNYEIVSIHKYTQPLSEQQVPSIKKAKYIVEVIEGFCDKVKIKEGDYIRYNRITTQNKQ